MIVKNEERVLPRLAKSIHHQIDRWTIVDTGSEDRTVEIARDVFAPIPGDVVPDTWRGYGESRNVAIGLAEPHTDWLLTLDADESVAGDIRNALPLARSGVECVEAELHYRALRLWTPRLFRSGQGWRWHGRAHEYLSPGDRAPTPRKTRHFHVLHHADGGNRTDKLERELGLLLADHEDDPRDPRTVFYIARTYDDMGQAADAATWYQRRIQLDGWDEERWYSLWRSGVCLLTLGQTDEGCGLLWRCFGERPWRAEPLHTLAAHYRAQGSWTLCWETCEVARRRCGTKPGRVLAMPDRLFVHADVYEWGMAYEQSIAAWYVGEQQHGRMLSDYLLQLPGLPEAIRVSVQENRRFYWPAATPA